MSTVIVFSNFPDYQVARECTDKILKKKLAACANIFDGCTSVFRWQGKVEIASEIPVFFKTTTEVYNQLEIELANLHPYDVPEIISWPIEFGFQPYLDWIVENVEIPKSNK